MRHRDRPAVADLLAKQRHHTAGRIKHVAEAHGDEARRRFRREVLAEDFRRALACSHDAGRVYRLVRGDQHEATHAMPVGSLGHGLGAEDIVAECLAHLRLQQRNMLEGGRMEHDLRTGRCEQAFAGCGITAVTKHGVDQQFWKFPFQFLCNSIQIVFGQLQDRQRFHAKACHLPAQFRTDRTAAAGYQDALAGQADADSGPVQFAPGHGRAGLQSQLP